MRFRGFTVAAMGALVVAPLAAQHKGQVEIGGFGRYTGYPDSYDVRGPDDNRLGAGGRLGYFLSDHFALEADASWNPTDLRANQPAIPSTMGARSRPLMYNPWNLRGVYNFGSGSVRPFLGAGIDYTRLSKGIEESYVGPGAIAGLRLNPASWLSLRLEGTADYIPSGFNDESDLYLGAQAGLSFLLGGKGCDHSTDMIGIRPTTAELAPGGRQAFSAEASYCGKPDAVVYRLNGPGTIDSLTGQYMAGAEGCGQVTAYSVKGKLMSSANVCTRAPAPPPPPPTPAPAPPPPPAKPVYQFELQMVHFRFDRSDLTQGATDTLKAVAQTLKDNPQVNVELVGHTDWISTNAYNMRLSQARAETVRKYLIGQGIAADRITTRWRGEEEPIADNNTAAGRAMNRRTEIKQNN
jgi:OOP family OmpA-OmpF porin